MITEPHEVSTAARLATVIARALPRGGFRLLSHASRIIPSLRDFPVELRLIPGTYLVADLTESIWYPLWRHGCYPHQMPEDRLARHMLRPGDTVWDVGANNGYTAVLYADIVGTTGSVVAFEPSRRSFAYLARSLEGVVNATPMNVIVSNTDGVLPFLDRGPLDLSGVAGTATEGAYDMPSICLDTFWDAEGGAPDFLKIDVEGHEEQVLEGAAKLIAAHLPIVQFEALGTDELATSMRLLGEASSGLYSFYRATAPARLVAPTDGATTNDYYALTPDHLSRFAGLLP